MKVWLSLIVSIVALAATPAIAMAGPDSVHYGPINSATPDSGTCGNNWANDTFKRVFDAATKPNADGTYNVTETFIAGRFVTVAGPSPNGCDPVTGTGGSIAAGVTGSFNGNFVVVVSGGTFDPTATCESGCDNTEVGDLQAGARRQRANRAGGVGPVLDWKGVRLDAAVEPGDQPALQLGQGASKPVEGQQRVVEVGGEEHEMAAWPQHAAHLAEDGIRAAQMFQDP